MLQYTQSKFDHVWWDPRQYLDNFRNGTYHKILNCSSPHAYLSSNQCAIEIEYTVLDKYSSNCFDIIYLKLV